MIEKSLTIGHPADPELQERLRLYLPYLFDPIPSLEIVSGARPECHPNRRSLDLCFLAAESSLLTVDSSRKKAYTAANLK